MNITVYTAPTTEPLTVAEVMEHCRIDSGGAEPAPDAPTVALAGAGAGNVDNGAHRYLVVFGTADGKTQGGTVSAAVTVADKTVNGKVALSAIPLGGSMVTYREIYRTAAGGSTYLLLATIADNTTTTYTDNIADSALGAGAPTANTTTEPLLNILIASARRAAEAELHRYLITQTLEARFDEFPDADDADDALLLPPLQSVASITYIDIDGATQTLDAAQYLVDAYSAPARITPAYGYAWPSVRDQMNAVTVRFVAGYGAASAVPQGIKNWMLYRIATLYQSRSQLVIGAGGLVEIPPSFIDSLLDPERVRARI